MYVTMGMSEKMGGGYIMSNVSEGEETQNGT